MNSRSALQRLNAWSRNCKKKAAPDGNEAKPSARRLRCNDVNPITYHRRLVKLTLNCHGSLGTFGTCGKREQRDGPLCPVNREEILRGDHGGRGAKIPSQLCHRV